MSRNKACFRLGDLFVLKLTYLAEKITVQLFYSEEISDKQLRLSAEEATHATKVLRLKEGSEICVTNGKGSLYYGTLSSFDKNGADVWVHKTEDVQLLFRHLHIAIAPTKNTDRIEWFLEKATEFGVGQITPVICDRSERRELRTDRLKKILATAMKQSLRPWLPVLHEAVPFKKFVKETSVTQRFIAHCEKTEKKELYHQLDVEQESVVLIGPEGDFSPAEIELARSSGFQAVSLGESRLRTETAGIAVAHLFAIKSELR